MVTVTTYIGSCLGDIDELGKGGDARIFGVWSIGSLRFPPLFHLIFFLMLDIWRWDTTGIWIIVTGGVAAIVGDNNMQPTFLHIIGSWMDSDLLSIFVPQMPDIIRICMNGTT